MNANRQLDIDSNVIALLPDYIWRRWLMVWCYRHSHVYHQNSSRSVTSPMLSPSNLYHLITTHVFTHRHLIDSQVIR
jgi:hypothetical protein